MHDEFPSGSDDTTDITIYWQSKEANVESPYVLLLNSLRLRTFGSYRADSLRFDIGRPLPSAERPRIIGPGGQRANRYTLSLQGDEHEPKLEQSIECENRHLAKQRLAMALLRRLNPSERTYADLLRLYGSQTSRPKERKAQVRKIVTMQGKRSGKGEPNWQLLDELKASLRRIGECDRQVDGDRQSQEVVRSDGFDFGKRNCRADGARRRTLVVAGRTRSDASAAQVEPSKALAQPDSTTSAQLEDGEIV